MVVADPRQSHRSARLLQGDRSFRDWTEHLVQRGLEARSNELVFEKAVGSCEKEYEPNLDRHVRRVEFHVKRGREFMYREHQTEAVTYAAHDVHQLVAPSGTTADHLER